MDKQDPEDRSARARRIAEAVMLAPDDARNAMIDSACGDDDTLRSEVHRHLSGAETSDSHIAGSHAQTVVDHTTHGTPDQIGRYTIRRVIQSGGMGTVYEALQENPRRRVAIKVMKAGLASPSALKRFEYESQVLGKLNHPTIAEIYEAGTFNDGTGEAPYFAMEYIEGAKPLDEWARSKRLSSREKLQLFVQVCDAIHHGHQKGVVHRDLKPDNVLVDVDGRPRVIDFGVARATDSDMQVATMQTDVGQLVGTLYYMSPEQCEADPDLVDTRSDVYALGVILFELLTGRRPHQIENVPVYDAARIIREEAPSRMSTLDRTLGGDLETIVGKALEKDKDRRYQSALELKQDIERYLASEPIEARPPSLAYQTRMFTRRHKALVTAVAAIFIVLAATTIWSLVERGRAKGAALAAQAAEQQAKTDRDSALAAEAEIAQALANVEAEKLRADSERQRAQSESERAILVSRFLFSMLEMASPEYAQGRKFTLPQLLVEASGKIPDSFSENPLMEADLRLTLGRIQQELGDIESAEPNLQRALILTERHLGTTHETTRAVNLLLAKLWIEQGRYDEAESRLQSILLAVDSESDLDDLQVLEANHQRVRLFFQTLRIEEALALAKDVVERSRRVLGPDHKETMTREINLVGVSSAAARLSGNPSMLNEGELPFGSVDRVSDALGEFHPLTLNARVAIHFREFARTDRPGPTEELRVLAEDTERVLGPKHLDTLNARSHLALFSLLRGEHETAVTQYQTVYDGFLEKYGRDHPETMGTAALLGASLMQLDRAAEAEPMLASAWYGQNMLWGEDDIRSIQAQSIWSMSLMTLGRFEEAEPHFKNTVKHVERLPMALAGQWLFGIMLERVNLQFEFDHSVDALVSTEELRVKIREREDADPNLRIGFLLGLAETLLATEYVGEAEVTTRQLLSMTPQLFAEDPTQHAYWLSRLTVLLLQMDMHELALEASQSMVELVRADVDVKQGTKTDALAYRGRALLEAGRAEEAIPLLEEAIVLLVEIYGPNHEVPLGWQAKLFQALAEVGRMEEARAGAETTLPLAIATMGPNDRRLKGGFEFLLAAIAQQDPDGATQFFDQAILACDGETRCRAEVVGLFMETAPGELRASLHPALRTTLDGILDAEEEIDAAIVRIACKLLLFELEIARSAETLQEEQAGMQLAYETEQLLETLHGEGTEELWQVLDEVTAEVEELIGSDHDRLIALHARLLAAKGNTLAAVEAYRRAAITSSIEDARRLYLERADALQATALEELAEAKE